MTNTVKTFKELLLEFNSADGADAFYLADILKAHEQFSSQFTTSATPEQQFSYEICYAEKWVSVSKEVFEKSDCPRKRRTSATPKEGESLAETILVVAKLDDYGTEII